MNDYVLLMHDDTNGSEGDAMWGEYLRKLRRVAIRCVVPDFRIEADPTRGLDAAPLGEPRTNAGVVLAEYEEKGGVRPDGRELDDLVHGPRPS